MADYVVIQHPQNKIYHWAVPVPNSNCWFISATGYFFYNDCVASAESYGHKPAAPWHAPELREKAVKAAHAQGDFI